MKITAIETLRTEEFANVLWVRVHTDAGVVGLGETFYGAAAVEAHVHDTLAARLLGKDPLRIEAHSREMVALPMAQSSTGVEYRAASAIDIALWDLFGKVCGQPVHQMLGGLCRDRLRVYNTCAGTRYVSTKNITPVGNWNRGAGRYEDLDAFMTDAGALAETRHRPFAPHDCIGPVGFAAAVHMSFSQPNTLIQESVRAFWRGWYKDLVTKVPRIEGGYVYPLEGPGLGVDLRQQVFERADLIQRKTEP